MALRLKVDMRDNLFVPEPIRSPNSVEKCPAETWVNLCPDPGETKPGMSFFRIGVRENLHETI
jgi:hypothetical protein